MAAIELYTPQGAEMVSGMMYEPYEQGVIMRLEHHVVGGYVRYISPHIIIIKFEPCHTFRWQWSNSHVNKKNDLGNRFCPAIFSIFSSHDDDYATTHNGRALLGYMEPSEAFNQSPESMLRQQADKIAIERAVFNGTNDGTGSESLMSRKELMVIRDMAEYMLSKGGPSCPKLNMTESHRWVDYRQLQQQQQNSKISEINLQNEFQSSEDRNSTLEWIRTIWIHVHYFLVNCTIVEKRVAQYWFSLNHNRT